MYTRCSKNILCAAFPKTSLVNCLKFSSWSTVTPKYLYSAPQRGSAIGPMIRPIGGIPYHFMKESIGPAASRSRPIG